MKTLFGAALAALALFTVAVAEDTKRADKDAKDIDQDFSYKACAAGLAEVNLGRIAAKHASDKKVKEFGQKMVDDHEKANKELIDLANKKNLKLASRMDAEHDKLSDKLAKVSGSDFDREYMAGQVKDHEEAVALFEKQAKDGKDKDLKGWADKKLPTLRDHLKMAKEINDKLGKGKGK